VRAKLTFVTITIIRLNQLSIDEGYTCRSTKLKKENMHKQNL